MLLTMQIWGCTRDEANHVVHEFFKSPHFAFGVLPMPGMRACYAMLLLTAVVTALQIAVYKASSSVLSSACSAAAFGLSIHTKAATALDIYYCPAGALHSLQRLKATNDLVVVTSRQHVIQKPTLKWLELHYPGIFQEVHFGNHWALEGISKPKSEICR